MSGLVIFLAVFAATAAFAILAQTHGVDSRTGYEDPRAPAPGIYT